MQDQVLGMRLPGTLLEAARRRAKSEGVTLSEAIRIMLVKWTMAKNAQNAPVAHDLATTAAPVSTDSQLSLSIKRSEFAARKLDDAPEEFGEFWRAYPRRISKEPARRAWSKMTPEERRDAITALNAHVKLWTEKQTEIKFIPHPSTWLRAKRWQDEVAPIGWRDKWADLLLSTDIGSMPFWRLWCNNCIGANRWTTPDCMEPGVGDWDGWSVHDCGGTQISVHIETDFDPTFGKGPYWDHGPMTRQDAFERACTAGNHKSLAVKHRRGSQLA